MPGYALIESLGAEPRRLPTAPPGPWSTLAVFAGPAPAWRGPGEAARSWPARPAAPPPPAAEPWWRPPVGTGDPAPAASLAPAAVPADATLTDRLRALAAAR